MSSLRRIESSRANGARSHGPITAEGKLRSSGHNLKHGLLAKIILLKAENLDVVANLFAAFERDLQPRNEVERALVENLAISRWRMLRLWAIERANLQKEIDKLDPLEAGDDPATCAALAFRALGDESRILDLLNRYEARFERQFNRALALLLQLGATLSDNRGAEANLESDFCHLNLIPISDSSEAGPAD
jgi:hypothetical protein